MPDQRSVMKEFRSLDAKRIAGSLTPAEEARYAHLRDLIGPEMGVRPGFDVDAAAARLRDSLLPAGLRNRPPPPAPAAPPAPEPAQELPLTDASQPAYSAEPPAPPEEAPQPDTLFDPGTFSADADPPPYDPSVAANDPLQATDAGATYDPAAAAYDPNAQPYEAAQGYDPSAQPQDPAQGYDPNAPAPWDAGAPYDAGAQAYDPNAQPYDPNVQAHDPDAPYDPSAQAYDPNAQPYDPNAYDPNAQPYAEGGTLDPNAQPWDPAQGHDPNALAAYDADASYDPNALAYDPNAAPEAGGQAYPPPEPAPEGDPLAEPAPALELGGDAAALPPDGWYAEAPAAQAAPYGGTGSAGPGEDAGLESLLPFDPRAEAAIAPGEVPEGFGRATGEYDDTAGFAARFGDPTPSDLPQEGSGFEATSPEATESWQADAVLDGGFQLASGGSFDAAAEAAAPEWAGGAAPPPWEGALAAEETTDLFAAPGPPAATAEAFEDLASAPEPTFAAPEEGYAETAPASPEYIEPLAPAAEVGAEVGADALAVQQPGAPEAEPEAEAGLAADEFSVDVEAEPEAEIGGTASALDFSQPDFSAGAPSDEEAAFVAAATLPGGSPAPEPAFEVSVDAGAEVPPIDLGPPADLAVEAPVAPSPAAVPAWEEDIPTIEGEEILEEIPPEDAAQAPAPEITEPEPSCHVPGAHRVVVHTFEGLVKRGVLEDVDLGGGSLGLVAQPGAAPETVPADKVKAIFFMLAPGEKAPVPEGKKVRVTFRDGRQVAGFSPDYRETGVGFFMIPGDTRTNTGRIWVYRSAVRQVSVS